MLSDSNQTATKGFRYTYATARASGELVGEYKLDCFFVKAFATDSEKPGGSDKFALHFGWTLQELNDARVASLPDRAPLTVDFLLAEPPLKTGALRSWSTSARRIAAARFELKSQFLDGLAPSELEVILARARRRHFLASSIVVNQGDPADRLFLLTNGRARYFYMTDDGQKNLLRWLTPGEIFGGAALLRRPSLYLVSTETVKDSSVLVWDRATIRGLATRYPRILENALLFASDYLTWYVAAHLALANHKAHERLARVLIYLAETIGQKVSTGLEFDATNQEIASAANVTPFTASRLLNEWQNHHALVKRRGKIILCSPERLFLHTA